MVKGRFTSLDVAAMVSSIRPHVLGARVANVYDISGKLFLIKFTSSLVAEDDAAAGKATMLIEPGIRFHLTSFERKKSSIPSGWTMNLRKILKGKQLERMDQVGTDRVVVCQFGINEKATYVIIELYAKGNVIVTDSAFRVQLLLRSYTFESGESIAKNEVYPMDQAANLTSPIKAGWESDPHILESLAQLSMDGLRKDLAQQVSKRKKKTSEGERILGKIVPFAHAGLLEAALRVGGLNEKSPLHVLKRAAIFATEILNKAKASENGFILSSSGQVQDFSPIADLYPEGEEIRELSSFSAAVDEYFSSIETSSEADRVENQRKALLSKVENIKADQQRRIEELITEQDILWSQAQVVESNLELTDSAILILNALIAKQMAWDEIRETVAAQGRNGHPVASKIGEIDFSKNRFKLHVEEDSVWIRLELNATGNVSYLHALRKHQKDKLGKTEEQAAAAIKAAERKLKSDLSKFNDLIERDRHLERIRRKFWYEKFYWFITSEGFLVIAGRDATQNEAIYKKYLKARDAYVHADIHGAATVVVKNHLISGEIPSLSLSEAGQFSLCLSSAWKSKIVTSAWWVRADQVSKTAPSGEYLITGSFMIRGKKNFLPPSRLELGVGVLFYVSEDSAASRPTERSIRGTADMESISVPREEPDTGIVSIVTTGERLVPKVKQVQISKKKEVKVETESKPVAPSLSASKKKKKGTKNSKSKDKYVFDDDDLEDEKIRQKLLGISKVDQQNQVEQVVATAPAVVEFSGLKACYICGQADGHLASDCPQRKAPVVADDDEEEEDKTAVGGDTNYNRLVGSLRSEDEPIHALAVCGPYAALSTCDLKVKIVPGSMKRGKAAKLCWQMFGSSADGVAKKLVKLIPVEEFSECLVNEVKVAGAGVTKLQVDKKKSAKLAKKQQK